MINAVVTLMSFTAPDLFLQMLAEREQVDPLAAAFAPVFGAALAALTVVLISALRNGSVEALRPVLQAYLVGDILTIPAALGLARATGGWTPALIGIVAATVVFAAVRVYALWRRMDWLATLHPPAAPARRR